MMSKHSFFKMMKEDMRHKTWMLALSGLGHFLMILVAWLIWRGNMGKYYGNMTELLSQGERAVLHTAQGLLTFFSEYLPMAGGGLAFAGAMIVGMAGFRFVFHRNMTDLYHALPIKRDTLYGVCWINGILIWFIPFIVCMGTVLLMGCGMAAQLSPGLHSLELIPEMMKAAVRGIITVAVVYLLVYHLVLTAVMLSGNLFNALISMVVLGVGVIAAYGLRVAYFDTYMATFYGAFWNSWIVYGSPLYSALVLLNTEINMTDAAEVWICVGLNLAVGLGLGVCAWQLYRRRASETAEQGIGIPAVAACLRLFLGTAGGMCGWGLFILLVSDAGALGWGIFGAVLASVCVTGILDMIFQMDVRAFFSHKLQMAAATGLTLFLCFLFYWDWIGYDAYLPDREEIAEIAVYDGDLTNNYNNYGGADNRVLENMHFQDEDILYAYLERMVENAGEERAGRSDRLATKITLNNGRSYYRYYWTEKEDWDVVGPILTSEEYLGCAYLIDEEEIYECREFRLETDEEAYYGDKGEDDSVRAIIRAYNQDVRENPEAVMLGEGRILAIMSFSIYYEEEWGTVHKNVQADVYESMEHTVEALRKAGYEVPSKEAGIQFFELTLTCSEMDTAQAQIALARERYGVYGNPGREENAGSLETESGADTWSAAEEGFGAASFEQEAVAEYEDRIKSVMITDREEVEEVTALVSFLWPSRHLSVFGKDYIEVKAVRENGSEKICYILQGALPEKYILRFGE